MRKVTEFRLALATAALTLAPLTALAGTCDTSAMPATPAIPTAEQRNVGNMLEAQAAVKSYVEASREHLKCVHNTNQHNHLVDQIYAVADAYNAALQDFKASTR